MDGWPLCGTNYYNMLAKRVMVAAVLLPIGLVGIYFGGIAYTLMIALILGLAAWEFANLFKTGGLQPAGFLVVIGALLFTFGRAWDGFESAPWMASLLILVGMAFHLFTFERGRDQAGTDFSITLSGFFYIGWLGAYLVSLRNLEDGLYWVLLVLPAVWLADAGAYFIGKGIGRHNITPRLSPKKTWEGYLGGIVTGTLGTALLAYIWAAIGNPGEAITPENGAILGLVLSVFTILGDLGESMIKRQVGKKDSSNLLPGHGGAFDRIDSWLWAGVIGYYVVVWFLI
jgi:phosphatidate cytidylyltransferase